MESRGFFEKKLFLYFQSPRKTQFEAVRFEFACQAVWEVGGAEKVDDSAEKPDKYQYLGQYEADYFYGKGYGPPDRGTADYVAVEDVFFQFGFVYVSTVKFAVAESYQDFPVRQLYHIIKKYSYQRFLR